MTQHQEVLALSQLLSLLLGLVSQYNLKYKNEAQLPKRTKASFTNGLRFASQSIIFLRNAKLIYGNIWTGAVISASILSTCFITGFVAL